jgi:hypothetical protein
MIRHDPHFPCRFSLLAPVQSHSGAIPCQERAAELPLGRLQSSALPAVRFPNTNRICRYFHIPFLGAQLKRPGLTICRFSNSWIQSSLFSAHAVTPLDSKLIHEPPPRTPPVQPRFMLRHRCNRPRSYSTLQAPCRSSPECRRATFVC